MSTGEIYKHYKQGLESGINTHAEMISYIERLGDRSAFFEEIGTRQDYDDNDVPVTTGETNDTNNENNIANHF